MHRRADLRIEMEPEVLIIDFKTGARDVNQLIIYEWLYYLLDSRIAEDKINSIFWMILDAKPSPEKITSQKRDALLENILDTLSTTLAVGYLQGKKAQNRNRLKNITRADLYHPQREGQNA